MSEEWLKKFHTDNRSLLKSELVKILTDCTTAVGGKIASTKLKHAAPIPQILFSHVLVL